MERKKEEAYSNELERPVSALNSLVSDQTGISRSGKPMPEEWLCYNHKKYSTEKNQPFTQPKIITQQ